MMAMIRIDNLPWCSPLAIEPILRSENKPKRLLHASIGQNREGEPVNFSVIGQMGEKETFGTSMFSRVLGRPGRSCRFFDHFWLNLRKMQAWPRLPSLGPKLRDAMNKRIDGSLRR
jgi:hypothetical protein